ncbi:MAG TPA: dihydrodipicolinate synthase family protein [Anseongella sp.]|nr:dihydrodipicolinate synthase family protein [Anseongella sp.]
MKKHSGVVVPLLSPFTRNMKADLQGLEKLLHFISTNDCHVFLLGTTGEGASIPEAEKKKIVQAALKYRNDRIKVYACVISTCLESTLDSAREYGDMGVDALAVPLPSYYTLSAAEMTKWYETLAGQSPCPLLLYNIPATTHMSIPLEVAELLSRHPNIEGIKDSEKGESRLSASLELWKDREDFSHLMGWAGASCEALAQGSDGLVPSSANLVPEIYQRLYQAMQKGDTAAGMEMQKMSDEVGRIYQEGKLLGESLAALKVLAAAKGLCEPHVMPPLQQLPEAEAERLRRRFADFISN